MCCALCPFSALLTTQQPGPARFLQFWLQQKGRKRASRAPKTPPAGETTEPLESWLLDYSDIDLAPLVDKVSARGKNADNVDWLASRLYYTHLAETVPT